MEKFSVYLDGEEIDYIVAKTLEDQLESLEKGGLCMYSNDPKEEKKAVKKAIKAYKFVLSEFKP